MLSEIDAALANNDSWSLEHTAHSLKGSIGHFAAPGAFEAAQKMEMIGQLGDLSQAEEAKTTLEKEIELLKSALIDLRDGNPEAPNSITNNAG